MRKQLKSLTCLILLACLVSCGKAEEVEIPPLSNQAESISVKNFTITRIGQWCGFTQDDTSVYVYPYYNNSKSVKVSEVLLSGNNFWYDFVSAKGFTLADVKTYSSGVFILDTGGEVFGFLPLSTDVAVLGHTSDLPSGYVKIALEHVTINR